MTMIAPAPTLQDVRTDSRWASIIARDKCADGRFWYSVSTTGVYCRPSCPSRAPNPGNVSIHDTIEAARATGCRPCKRCDPEACGDARGGRCLRGQSDRRGDPLSPRDSERRKTVWLSMGDRSQAKADRQ